jgi:hypothetical protein
MKITIIYSLINRTQSGSVFSAWAIDPATGEIFASTVRAKQAWDVTEFVDRSLSDFIAGLKDDGYKIVEVKPIGKTL